MGSFWAPFSKHGFLTFFLVWASLLGSKKSMKVRKYEIVKKPQIVDRKCMLLRANVFFQKFASHPGRVVHRKNSQNFLKKEVPRNFTSCFLPSAARSKTKWAPLDPFSGFWEVKMGRQALLRIRGAHSGQVGWCVVCVCGAVWVCGKCRGVSNACY